MKARNGATFAELAVLRALQLKGGEASFADLAKMNIRGVEKILKGMLPAKSRPNSEGRKTPSGRVRAGRAGLIGRTYRDGQIYYRIAPAGTAGASFAGPWTQKTLKWAVEWTPARVSATGQHGEFVGHFSESGLKIAGMLDVRARPDRTDWRKFREVLKTRFSINVPSEAVPDFIRFTDEFMTSKVD